jgi:hypothetical protein
MRETATYQILDKSSSDENEENYIHWDEFLGNYANKTRAEDRNFATAMAVNALYDIWTVTKNNTRYWIDGVPQNVTDSIKKGINYINDHIDAWLAKNVNAFFSGSVKGDSTIP